MSEAPGIPASRNLAGLPASEIAARVRAGEVDPVEVVRAHLDVIRERDGSIGAFREVLEERALEEARMLARRRDVADLPLAGVPVAIKDNVPVQGVSVRNGSAATPAGPCADDHEVVRRVRAAGAIVVGITRVPELSIWATSEDAWGVARNPWNRTRTPGGSSGGSAAAVASGMVPIAHGNDAAGSIRIPAACCGVVGIKPGAGVVPSQLGVNSWFGMAENGAIAGTVTDAALMLAVLAYRADLRAPVPPGQPLRIAVSTRSPLRGTRVDREFRDGATLVASRFAKEGHHVEAADPPYTMRIAMPVLARWFAGAALDAHALDPAQLQKRTRTHTRLGRLALRTRMISAGDAAWFRHRALDFFQHWDVLMTPGLAAPPIPLLDWHERSWIANIASNASFAPFCAPWNLAGFPACTVPAGIHSTGMPLSVQMVAAPGRENILLSLARQLELLQPWPRNTEGQA
jgi:amidase